MLLAHFSSISIRTQATSFAEYALTLTSRGASVPRDTRVNLSEGTIAVAFLSSMGWIFSLTMFSTPPDMKGHSFCNMQLIHSALSASLSVIQAGSSPCMCFST